MLNTTNNIANYQLLGIGGFGEVYRGTLKDETSVAIKTAKLGNRKGTEPEYYRNYQLLDKSDVYSFGVVLLELVTFRKVIDFSRNFDYVNLVVWVLGKHEEGKVMDVVESRLTEKASPLVLDTIRVVALMTVGCLKEKRQDTIAITPPAILVSKTQLSC
ncbi:hypothetical protein SUGI_0123180 [Cryptomeria japonica]|nr:hypothetical protein SUGI_0123180 [Cryptomeria japonica]